MPGTNEFFDIKTASRRATEYLGKMVTPANIAYFINYGRIPKFGGSSSVLIANDDLKIGSMKKRQSKSAQAEYAHAIASVLNNCRRFPAEDFDVFLVANDKYNLYPHLN